MLKDNSRYETKYYEKTQMWKLHAPAFSCLDFASSRNSKTYSTVQILNKMCNLLICCYAHKLGENAVVSVAMWGLCEQYVNYKRVYWTFVYLTDDGGDELGLVVHPLWTLDNGRVISDDQATVPAVELAAVVNAVVEWKHLTRAVLDVAVTVDWLCWNSHVLLYVVRQVVQLWHVTPVRHVAGNEDDLNGVGSKNIDYKHSDENSPLIGADISDVSAEVAFRHSSAAESTTTSSAVAGTARVKIRSVVG